MHIDERIVYAAISVIAVMLFLLGALIHEENIVARKLLDSDAQVLWNSIQELCDVTGSVPELEPALLPNGNLGVSISCVPKTAV